MASVTWQNPRHPRSPLPRPFGVPSPTRLPPLDTPGPLARSRRLCAAPPLSPIHSWDHSSLLRVSPTAFPGTEPTPGRKLRLDHLSLETKRPSTLEIRTQNRFLASILPTPPTSPSGLGYGGWAGLAGASGVTGFSSRPSCKPGRTQTLGQREPEPKDGSDHVHGAVPALRSVPHPCRGDGSHSLAFPLWARTEAPGVGPLIMVPCGLMCQTRHGALVSALTLQRGPHPSS